MKYPLWKRIFDLIVTVMGLVLILPLAPFIAIAIKLESEGPVVVKLERVSEGRKIRVYKFRSMVKDAETMKASLAHLNERKDGPLFKIKNDPRLTRVGKLLRKFRLDEFPQLVNVLKGELAIVGPRPREPREAEQYPVEYKRVLQVRQGVTGLSQVSGASSLPFAREIELDRSYTENVTFLGDLKILLKTIAILFFDPTAV